MSMPTRKHRALGACDGAADAPPSDDDATPSGTPQDVLPATPDALAVDMLGDALDASLERHEVDADGHARVPMVLDPPHANLPGTLPD
eukprot:11854534-Alexandrium_andersonii.AAC.1